MLAAFNGGHHNIHEVQMITKGTRFTIGSFWDNEEAEYSEEKQAMWETDMGAQGKVPFSTECSQYFITASQSSGLRKFSKKTTSSFILF